MSAQLLASPTFEKCLSLDSLEAIFTVLTLKKSKWSLTELLELCIAMVYLTSKSKCSYIAVSNGAAPYEVFHVFQVN